MSEKENKIKQFYDEAPKALKTRWFVYIVIAVVSAVSTFLLLLVDKVNFKRAEALNNVLKIDFNIAINTWGLLLIILGALFIGFTAFFFYKPIKERVNAAIVKKSGKEMDTRSFVFFLVLYALCVAILAAGLVIFSTLWFPWDIVQWKGTGKEIVENFFVTLAIFLLIALIVAIIVLVITILVLVFKKLFKGDKKEAE